MRSLARHLIWLALGAGGSSLLLGLGGFLLPGLKGARARDGVRAVSWSTAVLSLGLSIGAWTSLGVQWGMKGFGLLVGTGIAAGAVRMGIALERRRLARGLSPTPPGAVWLRILGFFLVTFALSVAFGAPGAARWEAAGWIAGLSVFCSAFALLPRGGAGPEKAVALRSTCFGSAAVALVALGRAIAQRWRAEPGLLEGTAAVLAGAAWTHLVLALGAWLAGAKADRAPERELWPLVAQGVAIAGGLAGLAGLAGWVLL